MSCLTSCHVDDYLTLLCPYSLPSPLVEEKLAEGQRRRRVYHFSKNFALLLRCIFEVRHPRSFSRERERERERETEGDGQSEFRRVFLEGTFPNL